MKFPVLKKILSAGLQRLIKAEPDVTRYDSIVGDGDCGVGLKRGAESVQNLLESELVSNSDDLVKILERIVSVVETSMDGTSGALYTIFLNSLVAGLRAQDGQGKPVNSETWSKALDHAVEAIGKYTPAQIGDRTMIGPGVTLSTAGHPVALDERYDAITHAPITIGEDVWIGAGATVTPGVTIGRGSVVGAGAVVAQDVPPMSVVTGTSAIVRKDVPHGG